MTVLSAGKKEFEEKSKRVSESGMITLPLLGTVSVTGAPPQAAADRLTVEYRRYLVHAQVLIDYSRGETADALSPWGYVTILGCVKTPGRIAMPPTQDLTVSRAVQQAGGLCGNANETRIRIVRRANGEPDTREVNLRAIGESGALDQDAALKAGDVLFVPELLF